jgi:putative proteasome-type protease
MSFALAIHTNDGIIFGADTRMNAGLENVATYRKLFCWNEPNEYAVALLFAGNLATQRHLVELLNNFFEKEYHNSEENYSLFALAKITGDFLFDVIQKSAKGNKEKESMFHASCVLGGQVRGKKSSLFHIYPEGNFIELSDATPMFQIGEYKYSKPLLDTYYHKDSSKEEVIELLIKSMDLTFRSNMSAGPPIDYVYYKNDSLFLEDITRLDKIEEDGLDLYELHKSTKDIHLFLQKQDFFDLLRELDTAIKHLSYYIRTINDPDRLTPEIKTARAYVDAFSAFLDIEGNQQPEKIPGEVKKGMLDALKRVEWSKVSDQAQKWVQLIVKIIGQIS